MRWRQCFQTSPVRPIETQCTLTQLNVTLWITALSHSPAHPPTHVLRGYGTHHHHHVCWTTVNVLNIRNSSMHNVFNAVTWERGIYPRISLTPSTVFPVIWLYNNILTFLFLSDLIHKLRLTAVSATWGLYLLSPPPRLCSQHRRCSFVNGSDTLICVCSGSSFNWKANKPLKWIRAALHEGGAMTQQPELERSLLQQNDVEHIHSH